MNQPPPAPPSPGQPPPKFAVDEDVFALTYRGDAELRAAGTSLSAGELQILVLIDGVATVAQIAQSEPGRARKEMTEVLYKLFKKGLITSAAEPSSDAMETGFFNVPVGFFGALPAQASPEADQGVSSLTKKGYFVRIARRRSEKREIKQGWRPTILLVDDDPDLLKLVRTYFRLEGFNTREATKRTEIMSAFREAPMPDLVLLDVELPDANGFLILARMRQHPVLKSMPVVMLTAEATREAVLKGLQAGADGYITKPFEADLLVTAVKEVLGIPARA